MNTLKSKIEDKSKREKPKHIHQWIRAKKETITSETIFKCIDPDCTSYKKRWMIEGKRALCNNCRSPFILTKLSLKNAAPHCPLCFGKHKHRRSIKNTTELVSNVLDDMFRMEGV